MGDIFPAHEFLAAPVEDASGDRSRRILRFRTDAEIAVILHYPLCAAGAAARRSEQVLESSPLAESAGPEVVLTGINLGRWDVSPASECASSNCCGFYCTRDDVNVCD